MAQAKLSAKDYLLTIFYTIKEIEEKKRLIVELVSKQAPKGITIPNLEKVGSSSHFIAPAENFYQKIVQLQQDIAKLNEKVTEAVKLINTIRPPQQRAILMYRYIYGMQWSKISDLMRLSTGRIFFLHRESLMKFEEILR